MAGDSQIELRVSRLENDSSSLYELLTEVSATLQEHSRRFDGLEQRFEGFDRRFDTVEVTLAEVLRRLPEPS